MNAPVLSSSIPEPELPWINPIGGIGDMLMLSGVLKLLVEQQPSRRFNLIRRSGYDTVLGLHPAIAGIGFVPRGAHIQRVDYWSIEKLGPGRQRPMQVLARAFGLETPVSEQPWLPGPLPEDPILESYLPSGPLVAFAPASDSPRKIMKTRGWQHIAELLAGDGVSVVQLGRARDPRVPGTHSLLGLTTPRQAMALLKKCRVLVTSDSFLMHAARAVGIPAVVLWGATHHSVYGYPDHVHFQMPKACGLGDHEDCIGPERNEQGKLYAAACPHGDQHCMDQVDPVKVHAAVGKVLGLVTRA